MNYFCIRYDWAGYDAQPEEIELNFRDPIKYDTVETLWEEYKEFNPDFRYDDEITFQEFLEDKGYKFNPLPNRQLILD